MMLFAKRLTDYSQGHITVKNDKTVQINGRDIVTPAKTNTLMAAYLIAGNLAGVYQKKRLLGSGLTY